MNFVILAENEALLEQLIARVARYNLQPALTIPTLNTLNVDALLTQFSNAICLVGATTQIGAARAEHFAFQKTLAKLRCRCVLAIPEVDETPLHRLALYQQCRIVRWEDSDEHWINTLQLAQVNYDSLPEDMYRQLNPNILTRIEPMRTPQWDGSEPIRLIMQRLVPGFKKMFHDIFDPDDRFDLILHSADVEASYQAVLDHNPHVFICDPLCRISRTREITHVHYHPHYDLPWLLRARPDLRIMVTYENPRLPLLRLVQRGQIQGFLSKCEEDFPVLKDYIISTARGETRLSKDAQITLAHYLKDDTQARSDS